MKFFCSSLDIRDNFKVAFFGKNVTNIISKENCPTFISGNQYDRLIQQSFLEAALLDLATAVGRKVSILLRGEHKKQVQSATKTSQTGLSSTQLASAKFTQLKFLTQPLPKTVVQFHRIDNSIKPEPITSYIFGLLDF